MRDECRQLEKLIVEGRIDAEYWDRLEKFIPYEDDEDNYGLQNLKLLRRIISDHGYDADRAFILQTLVFIDNADKYMHEYIEAVLAFLDNLADKLKDNDNAVVLIMKQDAFYKKLLHYFCPLISSGDAAIQIATTNTQDYFSDEVKLFIRKNITNMRIEFVLYLISWINIFSPNTFPAADKTNEFGDCELIWHINPWYNII